MRAWRAIDRFAMHGFLVLVVLGALLGVWWGCTGDR